MSASGNWPETLKARCVAATLHPDQYRHWRVFHDADQVWWACLDKLDNQVNTLDAAVLGEFDDILDALSEGSPRALVLCSLKSAGFCAGADIGQFRDLHGEQLRELIQRGHGTLDRLESLSVPTIAVIHGHCLGGGLELALACQYRVGVTGKLEAGFPEILLGLHPGLGGTFRLIEQLGPVQAMTLMLTGRSVHEKKLQNLGLSDFLVDGRHVEAVIAKILDSNKARPISKKSANVVRRLANTYLARQLLSHRMLAEAEKSAPTRHYPAPAALVALWRKHGNHRAAMQRAEQESFVTLTESATSRNLVRVFSLREGLRDAVQEENTIRHVHVIGAGSMGRDIAAWCALQGFSVSLADLQAEAIAGAVQSLTDLGRRRHKSRLEVRAARDRLIPDPAGLGVARADLVIEAVPEKLALKQSIYQDIEPHLQQHAVLATNTSSIPLEKLAANLQKPARLVGLHFFNPVDRMLVVEVVSHAATAESVRQQAMAFARQIGKLPVAVTSYPGFLVNRTLTPYLLEAAVLLEEGVAREIIDQVAVDFGMPMGPLELADQIGLDICLDVADTLAELLDTPMAKMPGLLRDKVEQGQLGRKTGQGIYGWRGGKIQKGKTSPLVSQTQQSSLEDRLMLPLLNACVECYRQGVVNDLDHLDAAIIFATGFAPFRGGPIQYARGRGITAVVGRLEEMSAQYGERFQPDPGWRDL